LRAAVIVVSRRNSLVAPLREAAFVVGLDVDVGRDPGEAAAIARIHGSADDPVVGVVVDVDDHGSVVAALCDELRLVPGLDDVPVVLLGAPHGPLSSTAVALDVGADAFFALPVDAGRVIAKLLASRALPAPPSLSLPTNLVPLPDTHADPAPAFVAAATPDELLAALESTDVTSVDGVPSAGDDADAGVDCGVVEAGGVASLLWAAHRRCHSGSIDFLDDAGGRRGCFFVDGALRRVHSTVAAERPDEILVRLGLVTPARLASALDGGRAPAGAGALCAQLAQAGALLPDERAVARRDVLLEQLAAVVLLDGAAWQRRDAMSGDDDETGSDADDADNGGGGGDGGDSGDSGDGGDGFGLGGLLVQALRRRFDLARLYAAVGGGQTVLAPVVDKDADRDEDTEDAGGEDWRDALHDDEALALAAFDGKRDVDAVVATSGLARPTVLRAALFGRTFGVLRHTYRAPAPSQERVHDEAMRTAVLWRERVLDRLARARAGDPVRLLSLLPDATAQEVAAAAATLRARFDPARAGDRGIPELRDVLVEIVAAIDAAAAQPLRR
jgi:hypothetical protein